MLVQLYALQLNRQLLQIEIERGWHMRPLTPADLRICTVCNVVEDEKHMLLHCVNIAKERIVPF